jgi:hypothetical protein
LTQDQRLTQLDCWYAEAQAEGITLCEKLAQEACASLSGGESGGGVSSAASGGHSVSYFDRSNQPIDPAFKGQFAAWAYQACKACQKSLTENPPLLVNPLIAGPVPTFTDENVLECMKTKVCAVFGITCFMDDFQCMRVTA